MNGGDELEIGRAPAAETVRPGDDAYTGDSMLRKENSGRREDDRNHDDENFPEHFDLLNE